MEKREQIESKPRATESNSRAPKSNMIHHFYLCRWYMIFYHAASHNINIMGYCWILGAWNRGIAMGSSAKVLFQVPSARTLLSGAFGLVGYYVYQRVALSNKTRKCWNHQLTCWDPQRRVAQWGVCGWAVPTKSQVWGLPIPWPSISKDGLNIIHIIHCNQNANSSRTLFHTKHCEVSPQLVTLRHIP